MPDNMYNIKYLLRSFIEGFVLGRNFLVEIEYKKAFI